MRILITAAIAAATLAPVALPTAATAQSYREVEHNRRELQRDRQDVRDAYRNGDRRDVRDARQELREDRQEAREDWRDYRRTNRDVFRRGVYAGPRGYRYRPVTVGYRFQPSYYARNYWLNDYNRYRLTRPGYNQQYVRYGNDVVLVDVRTGRVVRVFNSFFY